MSERPSPQERAAERGRGADPEAPGFEGEELAEAMSENAEIQEVWRTYKQGPDPGNRRRNRLIEWYYPIVRGVARRVLDGLPGCVQLDDLISAGIFGLIDAIEAFDPARGVSFETYCVQRVRYAMIDELREMDLVPRLIRSRERRQRRATQDCNNTLGRAAIPEELAGHLQVSVKKLEEMQADARALFRFSVDSPLPGDNSADKPVRWADVLEDRGNADTEAREEAALLAYLTIGLSTRERLIIILYYYEGQTMEEIGRDLGVSESRISQVHSAIIARLRKKFRGSRNVADHLERTLGQRRSRQDAA